MILLAQSSVFGRLSSNQSILRPVVTIPKGPHFYLERLQRKKELAHATINMIEQGNPTHVVASIDSSLDGYSSNDGDGVYCHTRFRTGSTNLGHNNLTPCEM